MKERSVVLNTMSARPGEILEKTRYYLVKKKEDGKMFAVFGNNSTEDIAIKLTFTALEPYAPFEAMINHSPLCFKYANAAGILECRFVLSGMKELEISEIGAETRKER